MKPSRRPNAGGWRFPKSWGYPNHPFLDGCPDDQPSPKKGYSPFMETPQFHSKNIGSTMFGFHMIESRRTVNFQVNQMIWTYLE